MKRKRKLTEDELSRQLDFLKQELTQVQPPQKKRKLDHNFITAGPSINKPEVKPKSGQQKGLRAKTDSQPIIIQSKSSTYEGGVNPRKKGTSKKTFVRKMGGKTWEDETLNDFPENDFRIFVGNLGPDVTDQVLADFFGQFKSFAMARVVHDKRTRRERGYGFVSLLDPDDFAKALLELDGEYIGTRPCTLRKSTWNDRTHKVKKLRKGKGKKKRKR